MDNVHDHLRNYTVEERRNWFDNHSSPAAVAMTHIEGDFNFSNVLRTANFLGFNEVFYIGGSKKWDRRGAVGVHNYIKLTYCKTIDDFFALIQDNYIPVALENNIEGRPSIDISKFDWPLNPVIMVGEEQKGIPKEILDRVEHLIEIPAYGTVRSMNVATAAGMAMFQYKQHFLKVIQYY